MTLSRRSGLLAVVGALAASAAGCTAPVPGAPQTPSDASPSASAPPSLTTPTAPPPAKAVAAPLPWAGVKDPLPAGPVNCLIVGTDNKTDQGNTDVLVLAQLSADRKRVTLVGIPRDSYVTLASGGRRKINAALYQGGIGNTKATVSNLFGGLRIHYVAQTNFADFIKLAVLFNGFSVANRIASSVRSTVTGKVTRFPRGTLTLHGADWLIYARQRKGLPQGEFDRGERHRAIVAGMMRLARSLYTSDPARLARIAQGSFGVVNVSGGLTRQNVLGLLPHLQTIDPSAVTSLKVPHAAVGDTVTLDYGRLGVLAAGLRGGSVDGYVARYGRG